MYFLMLSTCIKKNPIHKPTEAKRNAINVRASLSLSSLTELDQCALKSILQLPNIFLVE